jgi:hypothetical protein
MQGPPGQAAPQRAIGAGMPQRHGPPRRSAQSAIAAIDADGGNALAQGDKGLVWPERGGHGVTGLNKLFLFRSY